MGILQRKNESRDGVVIVSINDLFHILDILRTQLKENKKETNVKKDERITLRKTITKNTEISSPEKDKNQKEHRGGIDLGRNKKRFSNKSSLAENRASLNEVLINNNIKNENKNHKKKCCNDYFFNLSLCNFLLLILNNCYIWILLFMLSKPKNNSYCYNVTTKEFETCDINGYCPSNGIHDFIYTNSDSIVNIDQKAELNSINEKYRDFYVQESMMFSNLNQKYSKTTETFSKYSVTVVINKNENYLFNNSFRVGCNSFYFEILTCLFFAFIIGNILFGLIADLWGRKNILILTVAIQIVGSFLLFIFSYSINNFDDNYLDKIKIDDNMMNNIIPNTNLISNYAYINNYKKKYGDIKSEIFQYLYIKNNFQKMKIFILFSFFMIFSVNSSVKNITLSYLIENALTEESLSLYYFLYILAVPLSLFITTFLVIYTDSFYYPILIIAILQFIIILIIYLFFFESQRFNFEYCYYSKITDFTEYLIGKENLRNNYRIKEVDPKNNNFLNNEKENSKFFAIYYPKDYYRIQTEINCEKLNERVSLLDTFHYTKVGYYKYLYINEIIKRTKNKFMVEKFDIYNNPLILLDLMNKEKQFKKKFLVISSFIISASTVLHLSLQKVIGSHFHSRENLISKKIFRSSLFVYILITSILILPFTHYYIKCFGFWLILIPSLFIIILSTLIYEIIKFSADSTEIDLSSYTYKLSDAKTSGSKQYLYPFVFIISLLAISLQYCLYFIIIKLTKTIYRCCLIGCFQWYSDLILILCIGLERYLGGAYYTAGLFSVIALVSSLFIHITEDTLSISEYREIKFDENKIKEK